MEKKVSVIIPFYSGVEWLCEAVQSVLDQTYKNFEIIVVNDGSKENVSVFLEKFGDKIIYRFKENGGPATARNLGIKISTGEYIAFLDSDDIWLPTKTEKQIAFMEEIDAMWSHTGFYFWNPDKNTQKIVNVKNNYDDVFLQSFVSLRISTSSVIVNRECFNQQEGICFPENMRYSQDTVLYQRLSKVYPLALVYEPLMNVRIRGNNAHLRAMLRVNVRKYMYDKFLSKEETLYKGVTKSIIFIYSIYSFNYKLINKLTGIFKLTDKIKEYIAKFLWILPYILERIYVKYLVLVNRKQSKYLLNK